MHDLRYFRSSEQRVDGTNLQERYLYLKRGGQRVVLLYGLRLDDGQKEVA